MSKVKKSWITLISLFAALFLILGLAFGLPKVTASANTYAPSSVFSAGTGGSVGASEKGEEEKAEAYVQFTFSDGGKVYFRRDLALKWYAKDKEGNVNANYFSMRFAFGEINFETFTIEFESAEENITKDGKAKNSLTFEKKEGSDTLLDVFVNKTEEEEGETAPVAASVSVDKTKDVLISFDEVDCDVSGVFNVYVENAEPQEKPDEGTETAAVNADRLAGQFENIGGYFMEYRSSSSSTPNTPITFTAKFPENTASDVRQTLLMKSLNGQDFKLNADNRVDDNAPAVLVLNEKVYAFKLGQKFSLSYEAIDVLDDNVTVTREYYMLKTVDGTSYMPNETSITTPSDANDETKKEYAEYEKYNYNTLTTSTYFLPSQENKNQKEYVAIRFKLDDDTDDNDTYVHLSWYAADKALETVEDCKGYAETGEGDDKTVTEKTGSFDFILVDRAKQGPKYNYLTADDESKKNVVTDETEFENAVQSYREALAVAADYETSKTSAGSGAYIYLPSLHDLIGSDYAGYRNLKFSIYYFKPSQSESATASSQTSLNYNALRLEITEKGIYKFRVLAQDASSNAMEYYLDGEKVTVTSSNIWDIEGIPEFTFEIDYKGPTIEETEEQNLGYRNDTYSFDNFDIVALTGYKTEYTLYRYNGANVPETVSVPSSYSDFVSNAETYFNAFADSDKAVEDKTKKILYEISVYQDGISSDDEAKWNRTDNDYYWDPDSSLSFVPQEAGYYVLKLRVDDGVLLGKSVEAFQVIEVRNPIDTIPGQSQWLEDNVLSVVLFAISGVLAIVVVVLFLVKPSEKKVEEVDLEKLKGKKKNKTGKKK